VAGELTLGGPPECPERPFCIPGLKETYDIEFGEFVPLDVGGPLTIEALDSGEIDVALLFTTQSVILDKGWVLLEDDKGLQNADNITPLWNTESTDEEAEGLLNEVSATLTSEKMLELNGRVDIDGEDPADVARAHLEEEGLL
jgi:osmoprotectant transport system substrate-binding protein